MKISIFRGSSREIIDVTTGRITSVKSDGYVYEGSENWLCLGAVLHNNFGNITQRLSLQQLADTLQNDRAKLFYKNGKAKFSIVDLDHGARRIWASPEFRSYDVAVVEG